MPKKSPPYSVLARYYDEICTDRFSLNMVEYTYRLLGRIKFRPKSVLDVCCGTGSAAVHFARDGLETSGLDGSGEMLKEARKKARRAKVKIKFYQRSLPEFELYEPYTKKRLRKFDLITSFFDSLNYLTDENDLRTCFENIRRHLGPRGVFIFDMNTFRFLKNIWPKHVNAGIKDDYAWVWKATADNVSKTATLRAVFFEKRGGAWIRHDEIHRERGYTNATLKKLLSESGFDYIRIYRCFRLVRPGRKVNRVAVLARAPG